jgi:hypothetical protein
MKYSSLVIAFLAFLLVGCKKEQEIELSVNGSSRIKELNYSVYQNYSSQFIYSQDGRLSKRITKAWLDDSNNYSTDTVKFEYNVDNNVSSIKFTLTSFTNLFYDRDGNIIQSDFFHDGVLISSNKYFYANDILQEIQNENGNGIITLLYDSKGNLSTRTYYFKGNKTRVETFLEYDDKPNPFKGNQLVFDNGGFDLEKIDYFSKNNPLKREVEWITYQPHTDTFSHTYIYNGYGYWTDGPRYSIKYNQ